jgi:hypothetical protein
MIMETAAEKFAFPQERIVWSVPAENEREY